MPIVEPLSHELVMTIFLLLKNIAGLKIFGKEILGPRTTITINVTKDIIKVCMLSENRRILLKGTFENLLFKKGITQFSCSIK